MKPGFTRHQKTNAGFTIIELLVVITIIGVLSGSAVFMIGNKIKQARDGERKTEIYEIRLGLEQFYIQYGNYPTASELIFNRQPLEKDGKIYASKVHADPSNRDPYLYVYNATPSGNPTTYDLCAYRLEAEPGSFCLHQLQ